MRKRAFADVQVGDRVMLRKRHPCGGFQWEVTRIGADIGVRCLTCNRRVLLLRSKFEKQVKTLERAEGTPPSLQNTS